MQYEVWELRSRSIVGAYDDEEQAVELVRRLLRDGWPADQLVLGAEDEAVDVDALPPSLTGQELVLRAGRSGQEPITRSV